MHSVVPDQTHMRITSLICSRRNIIIWWRRDSDPFAVTGLVAKLLTYQGFAVSATCWLTVLTLVRGDVTVSSRRVAARSMAHVLIFATHSCRRSHIDSRHGSDQSFRVTHYERSKPLEDLSSNWLGVRVGNHFVGALVWYIKVLIINILFQNNLFFDQCGKGLGYLHTYLWWNYVLNQKWKLW